MQVAGDIIWQDLPIVRPRGLLPAVIIRYSTNQRRELVRPSLRISRGVARQDDVSMRAMTGTVDWTGLLPRDATILRIGLLPGNGAITATATQVSGIPLMLRAARRSPRLALAAVLCHLLGWHEDAQINFQRALSPSPADILRDLAQSPAMTHGERLTTKVLDDGPTILVVLRCVGASADAIAQSWRALLAQTDARWHAVLVGASQLPSDSDPRATLDPPTLAPHLARTAFFAILEAGDRPVPDLLASLRDALLRNDETAIIYCDEFVEDGISVTPRLKPGWSPTLETQRPYVGHAVLVRAEHVTDADRALRSGADAFVRSLLFTVPPAAIERFARPLFRSPSKVKGPRNSSSPCAPAQRLERHVSLIVPVRDRPELLDDLLRSLQRHPQIRPTEIIIVDNGSRTPAMKHLLASLAAAGRARIVDANGPFNFSTLCNAGARAARGEVLLFLNNDTVFMASDTIARLLAHVVQTDVGAVGAKLLYPDGRVQHAGIALGLFGTCGHFGAGAPAGEDGWCGMNVVAHETSAVTGACLMVARDRFDAVGGFDESFAVEFGDVDLCLRLAARGWRTICDASVSLIHRESASRGRATFRRQVVHAKERALFLDRWREQIASDPYHHPAWPLYDASAPPN